MLSIIKQQLNNLLFSSQFEILEQTVEDALIYPTNT